MKLAALNTHTIQRFYNKLVKPPEEGGKSLPQDAVEYPQGAPTGRLHRLYSLQSHRRLHTAPHGKEGNQPPGRDANQSIPRRHQGPPPLKTLFTVTLFTGPRKGEALGHATAAFTLDVCGHVTGQMKQESANRMDSYIKDVLDQ